ncbi:hypothetical protein NQ315_015328 [Exocentrus adspersus]|uniref:DDE Tnp4 domain-containing protein n=1 Tax=Exocentrus adspersus TaxID=1586481 RepID=A0AAV8V642_9CUCU|nr:hypothetical protein NQ315_015328 [Exocentrus adspersus]
MSSRSFCTKFKYVWPVKFPWIKNHALSPEQMVLDSQIFLNSHIRARFENNDFDDYVLVGDSGYAVKKYLITPLAEPITRAEQLFNESQIRTRNCIERKFGLKLEKDEAVVISTAVLENSAKLLNEQDPPFDEEEEVAVNFVNDVNIQPYMNIYNVNNVNAIKS